MILAGPGVGLAPGEGDIPRDESGLETIIKDFAAHGLLANSKGCCGLCHITTSSAGGPWERACTGGDCARTSGVPKQVCGEFQAKCVWIGRRWGGSHEAAFRARERRNLPPTRGRRIWGCPHDPGAESHTDQSQWASPFEVKCSKRIRPKPMHNLILPSGPISLRVYRVIDFNGRGAWRNVLSVNRGKA